MNRRRDGTGRRDLVCASQRSESLRVRLEFREVVRTVDKSHVVDGEGNRLAGEHPRQCRSGIKVFFRLALGVRELAHSRFDADHMQDEHRPTRRYMAAPVCGPLRGCVEGYA